jgi:hypothetical protein
MAMYERMPDQTASCPINSPTDVLLLATQNRATFFSLEAAERKLEIHLRVAKCCYSPELSP